MGRAPEGIRHRRVRLHADERETINYCRERLAHLRPPVAVDFGTLPKTSTGKVQKYVLRDREWVGRNKRIN